MYKDMRIEIKLWQVATLALTVLAVDYCLLLTTVSTSMVA